MKAYKKAKILNGPERQVQEVRGRKKKRADRGDDPFGIGPSGTTEHDIINLLEKNRHEVRLDKPVPREAWNEPVKSEPDQEPELDPEPDLEDEDDLDLEEGE